MSALVRNEQRKYLATAANNLGVAAIVTGGVAPIAGLLTGALQPRGVWRTAFTVTMWLVVGISCMIVAQRMLRRLE